MRVNEPNTIEYRVADFIESVLPGITMPRATLSEVSPEALVDAIAEEMTRGARPELLDLANELGAPPNDSLCTVMSSRAMLMAAGRGRAFYQHELRGRIAMPEPLWPEIEVWDEGTIPVWRDGAFIEPKYFSFRQDAPFAAFNPVHRRKWRPHELLHGAVGFFWREDASRFETYVGARLNELLPVVHWYGLDEIFRPRCERHTGEVLFREYCPKCELAVRPYWEVEPVDRVSAVQFARTAQEHFFREMDACRYEIRTGIVRETPLGRLNASTDAIGYVYGHYNRLNSSSFRDWADMFLREGFDYFSDIEEYADRVEACAARLAGGVVVATSDRFLTLRQRRVLQDVGYRALIALEWLDPANPAHQAVERTVRGAIERCSQVVDDLVDRDQAMWDAEDALDHLLEVLVDVRDELPDAVADPLLALGLTFHERGRDEDWEIANLAEGIAQGAELTASRVDAGHIETFAVSKHFQGTGRIVSRFAKYLTHRAETNPSYAKIADLASLEAWAAEDPRSDEHAERFGQHLESLEGVRAEELQINSTMRRGTFGIQAVAELADAHFDTDPVELAAAYWRGELHVLVLDTPTRQALGTIENGGIPEDEGAVFALMDAAIVVYLPRVRRRSE